MNKCDICMRALPLGSRKVKVGAREYCGPEGSECHYIGKKSLGWRLTKEEAGQLLWELPDELFEAS